MPQARLPFHYAEESKSTGMTSVSGLAMYLEVAHAAGLSESASRHVKVREGAQRWTDAQMVTSLILLNTAGGESVDDPRSSRGQALRILESDDGLGRVMQSAETHGMRRGERRAHQRRWRKQRRRSVPSPSAVFRYLGEFHDPSEEDRRRPHKAFIPQANTALRGLRKVNADMVKFVQRHSGHKKATLDMDATLIETHKKEALYCYKKYQAYQPLTAYWAETDQIVHYRTEGERDKHTGQQYAEVCYVPNWIGHSKNSPDYRFIAIREPLRNPLLPGMESQLELSVPTMQMGEGGWYKVTGVVTNRGLRGDELVWWYRQRCGKGEEVHAVLKEDLAGGRLPSGLFGANAAWWAITVLAFNLNSAVKRLVLGREWVSKRLKAVRFGVINLAGRVVRHARGLTIRLGRGHPSYKLLVRARRRILALANAPPRA